MNPDPGTLFVLTRVANYYGSLCVCLIDGEPHASIENWDEGHNWTPVSRFLYDAVRNETP